MHFIASVLATASLAATALAATTPGVRSVAGLNTLERLARLQPPNPGGIPDTWPGPWWPDGNPFHSGLDYQGVCWYFVNIAATFENMTSASHEADVSNTVYWANHRGPWKFIERGYNLLGQALMTFEAQLLQTNEFRQPTDEQSILTCHQTMVTNVAQQVAVLLTKYAQTAGEAYIPVAICMSQRAFTLSYLTLANILANHIDDATLRTQFLTTSGATWTNAAGAPAASLIGQLIASLTTWCAPGTP